MNAASLTKSQRLQRVGRPNKRDELIANKKGVIVSKWRSRSLSIQEKFEMRISHVDAESGCWVWDAPNKGTGYGEVRHSGKRHLAHRLSYELHKGGIPEGLQVDHICRNRACVNPAHLRLLTLVENVLCGSGITAQNAKKDKCKSGHEFTEENTAVYYKKNGSPWRACKTCRAESGARHKATQAIRLSDNPCEVCGSPVHYRLKPAPRTCSRSCGIKLSHISCPRRPPVVIAKRCTVCGEKAAGRGLCGKHYMAAKRRGEF